MRAPAPADDAQLAQLGWTAFFGAQVSAEDDARLCPVRVMAVHRGKIAVAGVGPDRLVSPPTVRTADKAGHVTVGDWLLIDRETSQISKVLQRKNLFKRRTPGNARKIQLIAANVDTLFVVASCNQDFSPARIERYLVLARDVGVTPVIVLTKADLVNAPDNFATIARELQRDIEVAVVNAKDPLGVARLGAWCGPGKTVALLGSSGVGKSTLINTLTASDRLATQPIREGDGTGRHTTTVRELHRLDQGGWLMDTPGMRELHLPDAAEGLAEVFDEILELARNCRFSNCTHGNEPDCAVQSALAQGGLNPRRFERWRKLTSEAAARAGPGGRSFASGQLPA